MVSTLMFVFAASRHVATAVILLEPNRPAGPAESTVDVGVESPETLEARKLRPLESA